MSTQILSNIFSISVDLKLSALILPMWKMTPRYLMEMTTAAKWKMTRKDFEILKIKKLLFFSFLVKWELYCHFVSVFSFSLTRNSNCCLKKRKKAVEIHIISLKLWPPRAARAAHIATVFNGQQQTNCQNDQKFIDLHLR